MSGLLKELKGVNNGALLITSLEHMIQTLKQVEPGSFHTGDKLSYVLDRSLNDARNFIMDLITERATNKTVK